jgi:hypothetical protein
MRLLLDSYHPLLVLDSHPRVHHKPIVGFKKREWTAMLGKEFSLPLLE